MVERKRHLAKAITYRLAGSTVTAGVAYALSGSVEIGAALGVADTVVKVALYYAHERLWYRIKWGVHEGVPDRFDPQPQVHVRPVQLARPADAHAQPSDANAQSHPARDVTAA